MRVTVAVMAVLVLVGAGGQPWYAHYDEALVLIDGGRGAEAVLQLEAAVAERPEPGLKVRVYGNRLIEYLPYLYLTVASHLIGDVEGARLHLAECERRGVAVTSVTGRELIEAYRILLAAPASDGRAHGPASAGTSFRSYPSRPTVLDDEELGRVVREVEMRCGLTDRTERSLRPWYFHYELGLALAQEGDPQRALDALVEAADRRPVSRRGARMYGMWFTDYLPYFQIAKTHVELANWECALDALEVSRRMGEVEEDDDEYADFRRLLEEARQVR